MVVGVMSHIECIHTHEKKREDESDCEQVSCVNGSDIICYICSERRCVSVTIDRFNGKCNDGLLNPIVKHCLFVSDHGPLIG